MLSEILKNAVGRSSWANWVATHEGEAARETRELLDIAFLGLPSSKRSRLSKKIQRGDAAVIEATLYEILTHELLYQLSLAPDFDPKIEGKLTPDIAVEIAGLRFIVDVLVTHSPSKTITRFGPKIYQAIDHRERAQKILNTITEKSAKYAKTGLPLVLFVFLGDHSIQTDDVERALFCLTLGEIEPNERFQESFAAFKFGGVLLPDACGVPSHPNLSAIVACQWFDTLHRGSPGRRLHCAVLHHYSPHVPLPPDTFSPFPEVLWHLRGPTHWEPQCVGQWDMVARFATNRQLEFGRYTANAPW